MVSESHVCSLRSCFWLLQGIPYAIFTLACRWLLRFVTLVVAIHLLPHVDVSVKPCLIVSVQDRSENRRSSEDERRRGSEHDQGRGSRNRDPFVRNGVFVRMSEPHEKSHRAGLANACDCCEDSVAASSKRYEIARRFGESEVRSVNMYLQRCPWRLAPNWRLVSWIPTKLRVGHA